MFFVLILHCFCSNSDPQNLTEICINPLKGDCHGIFAVNKSSDFERYCAFSTNLTIYLQNDIFTVAFFNMNYLPLLVNCKIIGMTTNSTFDIVTDTQRSPKLNFTLENVNVELRSQFHSINFKSLSLNNAVISYSKGKICAEHIQSDIFSLSNSQRFCANVYDINASYHPPEPKTLLLYHFSDESNSNELDINLFGLNDDYSIELETYYLILTFPDDNPTTFEIYSERTNFLLKDTSSSNSITLFTNLRTDEINKWECGLYQLNIFHTGQLIMNLLASNLFFGKLTTNILNFTSVFGCTCKVLNFESSVPGNLLSVYIDSDIDLILYNDLKSNANFTGNGRIKITSDFSIEHFTKLYTKTLNFSNYASFKIDVTRDQKEAFIFVENEIDYLNDIIIYPVFDNSKFSIPDDIDSLLGKTLFTFCAPNADIDHFDVRALQYSDGNQAPPGFTAEAMSFSLQQNQNYISLVFAKDPRSFSTSACIYSSDPTLCENISDSTFNATKGETPFEDEITSYYINIKIAEDLPSQYSLNFSKLSGKHEISISAFPKEQINSHDFDEINPSLTDVNIFDSRPDTKETSLIFDRIAAQLNSNATNYNRIYLANGSRITNNVNLSTINSLEFDFRYSREYYHEFYECNNIKMHNADINEIIFYDTTYTFVKGFNRISFLNSYTFTLIFESASTSPYQIVTHILSTEIKPLIFHSHLPVPLFINFTDLTGQTPTNLIAVQLQLDSSSPIYISSPTYNIPVEITSIKDSSTFEKMKRIVVHSESNIVDRGFYPSSLTIREDNVSFIAFGNSLKRPIPSQFSEIDIYSDTFLLSDTYLNGKHVFGNRSFTVSDVKVNDRARATLIYGEISKSITVYEGSTLNLFHMKMPILNGLSITYHITLGQTPPLINLIENQTSLEMPSRTPFSIMKDYTKFSPQSITVEHKFPHRRLTDIDNDTVDYCILKLKTTDSCESLLSTVKFDPPEIGSADGVYSFYAKCYPQCLGVQRQFHKSSDKPNPNKLDLKTIIIISVLSGVTLILIIVIVVLVAKRKQNPNDYMKSLLMTLPSDM